MTTAPVGTAPLRERVAEELRALLARRKVTPTELGRRLGKSQTWVWRRLEGEVAFDLNDLEAIAGQLGVAVADLLPGDVNQRVQVSTKTSGWPAGQPPTPDRPRDNRPASRPKSRSDRPVSSPGSSRRPRLIGTLLPVSPTDSAA